ncbi:cell surface glycoprotein 1-like isoform X2 [Pseudopipra pipra]|uniref:cell surface glycoprotein 1-like isoform X2 n=1 Tax=Pseudopipra pipra TaxID=415032 RepID=UPI0031395CB5
MGWVHKALFFALHPSQLDGKGSHQKSLVKEQGTKPSPCPLLPGPVGRGQLSRQLSRHCSLPGSSWLSLPVPQPSEAEHNPKKPMSSSEPILDLKTDTAEAAPAHSNPEEPQPRPGTRQDPANSSSGNAVATSSHEEPIPPPTMAETLPGTDTEAEEKNPSPTNSLPWPEAPEECPARGPEECPVRAPEECPARAPEECPARPNTLDFSKSLKKLEEVKQAGQRRNSDQVVVKENGVEVSPAALPVLSEERKALESELGKCIEEFRKIKIPVAFPNKKRQWQSELLKKYQL